MNKQPHLLIRKQDIYPNVLLPGDPARVSYIAKNYLRTPRFIAQNREYVTYNGYYKNIPVTVTSTGIGCPSTAIAVEELINCGAKTLIRVGTCGGALKNEITAGAIIIPNGCIREEGTTREYIPIQFPAIADYRVVEALVDASKINKYKYFVGINRTHDTFYGQAKNIQFWGSPYNDPRMKNWKYPLISSEMETSALFIIALMRGALAGAVLAVNANPETLEDIVKNKRQFSVPTTKIQSYEAEKSIDRAIQSALDALSIMEKGNKYSV